MMLQPVSAFLLKLAGWKIAGEYPHQYNKCLIIVGPHTSNWDFPIGMLVKLTTESKASFIGKASLFEPPMGAIFRAMGGIPVVQEGGQNFVEGVVEVFNKAKKMQVVISPEGTRKKVEKLRTGFFHIAKGANIPIIPALFDWEKKVLTFSDPIWTDIGKEAVIKKVQKLINSMRGYHPSSGIVGKED